MTPKKIRPDDPRPTAPTWNFEIGGRAKDFAGLTSEGRSWRTETPSWFAADSASSGEITKLGLSIVLVDPVWAA